MTQQYPQIPLLVYSDRLSARPGESVAFKVSSDGPQPFSVKLTRSISADPNPMGQGDRRRACGRGILPLNIPPVGRPSTLVPMRSFRVAQWSMVPLR